jgi:protein tyrosine/serine phosphatase
VLLSGYGLFFAGQFLQADDKPVAEKPARDPRWATPITDKPGLPNLHKIIDNIYRGAQPSDAGFKTLKEMGIKTIINLRAFHSDKDEMRKAEVTFNYVSISFKAWHPENSDVEKFLETVTNKNNYPIFFHCQHGADRTGMMCAVYRIVVQGWSNDDALQEMTMGGYGFHNIWTKIQNYVKNFDSKEFEKFKP